MELSRPACRGAAGARRARTSRLLHDLPAVHDDHAVRDLGHDAQVMGDEKDGHVELVAELVDEVEDLRLDGDVERRGGLVGDQELGVARERHGDHDALPHAAGHLVREVAGALLGTGDAHDAQHLDGSRPGVLLGHVGVGADGLDNLVAHAVDGVERGHGLLEDHRDLPAADLLHLGLRGGEEVLAVEGDRAAGHMAGLLEQSHDGERRHGLARAGLAHHGEDLAALEVEGHAVDGADHALARGELGDQVVYL